MTVANNYAPIRQLGNGSTTQFSAAWSMIAAAYAFVQLEDSTTGVRTTVAQGGASNQYQIVITSSGFTVTMGTAPTSSKYINISRITGLDQTDSYRTSKGFQGEVEENSFDKLTAMVQDARYTAGLALTIPSGESLLTVLPSAANRALKAIVFDASGNVGVSADNYVNQTAAAAASAAAAAASASAASSSAGAASTSASAAATSATNASTSATNAANSATAAAASATLAQGYGAALTSTSTTSLAIGLGAATFVTQANKAYAAGQFISAISNANSANYMHGTVTSYSGTSLVTNITDIGGSGTKADWNLSISGSQGSTGPTGPTGATGQGVPTGGTAGQVLSKIDATNFNTQWSTAASGMTLLSTVNASGVASVVFSSALITNAYNKYVLEADGVYTTDAGDINLTLSTNNGVSYISSSTYFWAGNSQPSSSTTITGASNNATTQINLSAAAGTSSTSTTVSSFTLKMSNPSASAQFNTVCQGIFNKNNVSSIGGNTGTTPINNIKFTDNNGGNITGNFHLYGLQGS